MHFKLAYDDKARVDIYKERRKGQRSVAGQKVGQKKVLIWPGNRSVLLPPASGSEGNVEAQNEGQWNYFDECRTEYHNALVVSARGNERGRKSGG